MTEVNLAHGSGSLRAAPKLQNTASVSFLEFAHTFTVSLSPRVPLLHQRSEWCRVSPLPHVPAGGDPSEEEPRPKVCGLKPVAGGCLGFQRGPFLALGKAEKLTAVDKAEEVQGQACQG